ncbi:MULTISPECIES: MFS transporter [Staphylococcus]|uniref:MFS transporter n=1 Tax=Staphylococcus TaxID=1279 RepID=UPI000A59CA38|nr:MULTISPECIES: MFS transporter [Staphylococcus]MBU0438493.1 MFS transporter [Staphylococcus succinus]MDH9160708.1 MFS transporter [Staphylococcus succinus]MEB7462735.1 MFS transporter [Staphylococcus succinus]MEB8123586.1 MFS transporter [Staphylococcus succinus]PNZ20299.1 MFS transporter [Staphylococcus succinus subsp. succinus]
MKTSNKLIFNRTFMLMLLAGIFAMIGFSTILTTITWYAVKELKSSMALGYILVAATVPRLIMMTFSGMVADKFKKTTIMYYSNIAEALVLVILYFLIINDQLSLVPLMILAAFFGMLDAFFGPASTSLIPKVVEQFQLQRANSLFQGGTQISFIFGPIIAGIVMEHYSIATSFYLALIFVFLSAIFVFPPLIKETSAVEHSNNTPVRDIIEGFRYVKSSRFLITGIIILITANFFGLGALSVGIPILVEASGGTPINLTYLQSSLGVGMLTGTALLSVITFKKGRGKITLFTLLFMLVLFLVFTQVNAVIWQVLLLFLIGLTYTIVYIPFITMAQEFSDEKVTGRVMSLIFLAMTGFDPISYVLISGLNTMNISIFSVLAISASVSLVVWVFILFNSKTYRHTD